MNHSQTAIESAKGSTWDLDRTAETREWEGVDIGYSQHRDSDVLVRSNWETILTLINEKFGAIDDDFQPRTHGWNVDSLGHWAVGWVEFITFDTARSDIKLFFVDILAKIADYPVLDEELYSKMEWEENHPYEKECYCDDEDCPIKLAIKEANDGIVVD